jgi:hypothetical protein
MKCCRDKSPGRAWRTQTRFTKILLKSNYEHRAQKLRNCPVHRRVLSRRAFRQRPHHEPRSRAIRKTLGKLSQEKQKEIYGRAEETVENYV